MCSTSSVDGWCGLNLSSIINRLCWWLSSQWDSAAGRVLTCVGWQPVALWYGFPREEVLYTPFQNSDCKIRAEPQTEPCSMISVDCSHSSRIRFLRFFKIKKRDFLRFFSIFWSVISKKRKSVDSVIHVFTLLHFKIANWRFLCKTFHTYVSCYACNIIWELFIFGLKYNGFGTVRKKTKLIEGGHRGLQANRPICYYFYVFNVFYVFSKSKKSWLFPFFFRVSHVFSNYDCSIVRRGCDVHSHGLGSLVRRS